MWEFFFFKGQLKGRSAVVKKKVVPNASDDYVIIYNLYQVWT